MNKFRGIIVMAMLCAAFLGGSPVNAGAGVNVSVSVFAPPPPPLVIPSPPELAVIPGTYVYVAPDIEVDLVFFRGYWYRPVEGRWYRARVYNGPWSFIARERVPHVLLDLPPDYHHIPPGHQRMPYGQVKKNWRTWERERHWERHEDKEYRKDEKRQAKEMKKEEHMRQKEERHEQKDWKKKEKGKHGDD